MATRENIQTAIDRLVARGVTEIIAVPLFVSSWSSVITSTVPARAASGSAGCAGELRQDEPCARTHERSPGRTRKP